MLSSKYVKIGSLNLFFSEKYQRLDQLEADVQHEEIAHLR